MAGRYSQLPTRALLIRDNEVLRAFAEALRDAPGTRTQAHLDLIADGNDLATENFARRQAFPETWPDVVLDVETEPGWLLMGEVGKVQRYSAPRMSGLYTAVAIMRHGSAAVMDLAPGLDHPAEAIRNQLATFAAWAKSRCASLTLALNSPGIVVCKGRATRDPQVGPRVLLRAP